jgi:hypothetical protein
MYPRMIRGGALAEAITARLKERNRTANEPQKRRLEKVTTFDEKGTKSYSSRCRVVREPNSRRHDDMAPRFIK